MTVSDNTKQAESFGDFFKNLDENGLDASKKDSKNVLQNPGRALEIRDNLCTAFSSRSSKAALLSLP